MLADGIGDIVVDGSGRLIASVGNDSLVTLTDGAWDVTRVPGAPLDTWPWSGSLAVAADGTVYAGMNVGTTGGTGMLAVFDPDGARTIADPAGVDRDGDLVIEVSVADDEGTLWAATDRLYDDPSTATADEAAGIVRMIGDERTVYTMADGLLSNDGFVAAGRHGTAWAIHTEVAPTGYSRFDGTGWIPIPADLPAGGFRSTVTPDGTLWWVSDDGLGSFDGLTHVEYRSPFRPDGTFSTEPVVSRRRTLCGWFTADDIAGLIADVFHWTGPVRARPEIASRCGWALQTGTSEGFVTVSDAALWRSFGGGRYDPNASAASGYEGGPVEIGATVSGHPALSDDVLVHNGGFGQFAFWCRPERALAVSVTVPDDGEWNEEYEARFFAVADTLLHRVGWCTPGD
jgi:hypothetical protein